MRQIENIEICGMLFADMKKPLVPIQVAASQTVPKMHPLEFYFVELPKRKNFEEARQRQMNALKSHGEFFFPRHPTAEEVRNRPRAFHEQLNF